MRRGKVAGNVSGFVRRCRAMRTENAQRSESVIRAERMAPEWAEHGPRVARQSCRRRVPSNGPVAEAGPLEGR